MGFDKIQEECGVFGVYSQAKNSDVAAQAYLAMFALQHRGQDSCGIAVCDDGVIGYHRDLGLVPEVFTRNVLDKMGTGNMAIGHVCYSGRGRKRRFDAQPLVVRHIKGTMAVAHNGCLTNGAELREELELSGAIFHSTNDAEVISYVITRARIRMGSIEASVEQAMRELKGAYSLVAMSPTKLIAARDPYGFRPLCIGTLNGDCLIASETCALDALGADFVRDIEPGEIVVVDEGGLRSIRTHCGQGSSLCLFEFTYLARQDSVIEGASVHQARRRAGAFLAAEHPVDADVAIGIPDSGIDAAMGYAEASDIPYGIGFSKTRYITRTFILPTQQEREHAVGIKLNAISATVKGKRVVMVDDSIVRGTTMSGIISLMRKAGAKEIHVRISSPPFMYPCYFGTNVDTQKSLIANGLTIPEICSRIGADSLAFLSAENVVKIAENASCGFCTGCFTGEYPIAKPARPREDKFDHKIGGGIRSAQARVDDCRR